MVGKKVRLFIFAVLISMSLVISPAYPFTYWEGVEYKIDSDTLTIGWDISEGAEFYQVKAIWEDPTEEYTYGPWTSNTNSYVVDKPRTGHFRIEVAACNTGGCSDFSKSTDSNVATVDGQAKGWKVFWKLAAPTGPVISKIKEMLLWLKS